MEDLGTLSNSSLTCFYHRICFQCVSTAVQHFFQELIHHECDRPVRNSLDVVERQASVEAAGEAVVFVNVYKGRYDVFAEWKDGQELEGR